MKKVLLSTLLLPLALMGCAGGGAYVDSGYGYPGYYSDNPYYGPGVGVYYSNGGPYYGHYYHHYSGGYGGGYGGYSHVASTGTYHGTAHFGGARTASVSSFGHGAGGVHSSSAHASASVHR